jgi:hypothetical protein
MAETVEKIKCPNCDYKTERAYNMKRHMVTKYCAPKECIYAPKECIYAPKECISAPKECISAPKECISAPKECISAPKECISAPKCDISLICESSIKPNHLECVKCQKQYNTSFTLNRHLKICKGIKQDPSKCHYCFKVFSQPSCKYRHLKTCKAKQAADAKALVVLPGTSLNINNSVNSHNTTTNNNIHNNNNVTNIIVYGENMEFLNDHITNKKILGWLDTYDFENTVKSYNREILSRPENQFVKKNKSTKFNIRSTRWQ